MYTEKRFEETKELLKTLIGIPSVSGSEKELAEYIVSTLNQYGVDEVSLQEVKPERYNVRGTFRGGKPGKTTLLTGHIDVVNAGDGWKTDPFKAVEKDGRIYGRGSNDMKAGLAVMMQCIKTACENRENYPGNIEIAFLCDEEAYSIGANYLAKAGVTADFGLSAEPEFNPAIVGAAGKTLIKAYVKGVPSHAAHPQDGVNAVEDAAKFICGYSALDNPAHDKIAAQPYVTLRIDGGIKEYSLIVPDNCEILINKHTVPGETRDVVIERLQNITEEMELKSEFRFSIEEPYYPPYSIDEDNENIKVIKQIFSDVTDCTLSLGYGDGVSDNNIIVPQCGIPVICLGPTGGNMHAANDWVDIEEIKTVLKIYLKYLFEC